MLSATTSSFWIEVAGPAEGRQRGGNVEDVMFVEEAKAAVRALDSQTKSGGGKSAVHSPLQAPHIVACASCLFFLSVQTISSPCLSIVSLSLA